MCIKNLIRFRLILLITVLFSIQSLTASTTIVGVKGSKVFAANNEDHFLPEAFLWFTPSSQKELGAVFFGFEEGNPRGGLNEKGLFCNLSRCPRNQVVNNPAKETLFGNIVEKILTTCSSIPEVQAFYERYNLFNLHEAQLMVADNKGRTIILEGDLVVNRAGDFMVMTNFYSSDPELGGFPDRRFDTATEIMKAGVNPANIKKALSVTHREGEVQTIYSYICDLKKAQITFYHFHEFETPVMLEIKKEVKKGRRKLTFAELFGGQTIAKDSYDLTYRRNDITADIQAGRVRSAADKILNWAGETEEFTAFPEFEINAIGYQFLQAGNLEGAIEIFKVNVVLHPESGNVYDSLGEAYMNHGDTDQAIANYELSLSKDPGNGNAVDMLKRLRNEE